MKNLTLYPSPDAEPYQVKFSKAFKYAGFEVNEVLLINSTGKKQRFGFGIDDAGILNFPECAIDIRIQYLDGNDPLTDPFNKNNSPVRLIIILN
jgi:hypothetical protein